jgi:hypothetical protein
MCSDRQPPFPLDRERNVIHITRGRFLAQAREMALGFSAVSSPLSRDANCPSR